jgi:peptide/nickel transport system substrate-binding protein
VLPTGYDPSKPVGTGPFKYKSFTPGVESTFVRNPNYWIEGQPYLDEVKVVDFADDTSRSAALLSGQIMAMDSVDPTTLPEFKGHGDLETLVTKSGFIEPIVMRCNVAPFNDNRVRQAMRLLVNRPQMVEQAYGGYARIANDMPDPDDPAYPRLPQRQQDIEQAKSLLKAAGHENLAVTLTVTPEKGGLVASGQVFAEQAAAAGVKVTIKNLPPSAFDPGFKTWTFTDGYYSGSTIGTFYSTRYLPGGGLNDGSWDNRQTDAWYYAGLKETNQTKQNELFGNILRYLHDNGPDVIPVFQDGVDLYSSRLTGFVPFVNGWSLNAWRYRLVSFK